MMIVSVFECMEKQGVCVLCGTSDAHRPSFTAPSGPGCSFCCSSQCCKQVHGVER